MDITPGVRSLQIHYDTRLLSRDDLLEALDACERRIPDLDDIWAPSRMVHLPLSWDDPATRLAIRKYMQSVRPDAPWCPSNIEFIRRINGLDSIDDVQRIVFNANYLMLGSGRCLSGRAGGDADRSAAPAGDDQVQSGAHLDAGKRGRHRRRVSVRVRDGGSGRISVCRAHAADVEHVPRGVSPPWLLRFFDQIRFYPVTAEELVEIRDAFPHGGYPLRIEPQRFRLKEYHEFLASISESAAEFKRRQQEAFLAERERWARPARISSNRQTRAVKRSRPSVPEGCRAVRSPATASVWKVAVEPDSM